MGLYPLSRGGPLQDNQADIAGERKLNRVEQRLLEDLSEVEARLGQILRAIDNLGADHGDRDAGRWASLARTNGEQAFMYATRAITRPNTGLGRKQRL